MELQLSQLQLAHQHAAAGQRAARYNGSHHTHPDKKDRLRDSNLSDNMWMILKFSWEGALTAGSTGAGSLLRFLAGLQGDDQKG